MEFFSKLKQAKPGSKVILREIEIVLANPNSTDAQIAEALTVQDEIESKDFVDALKHKNAGVQTYYQVASDLRTSAALLERMAIDLSYERKKSALKKVGGSRNSTIVLTAIQANPNANFTTRHLRTADVLSSKQKKACSKGYSMMME